MMRTIVQGSWFCCLCLVTIVANLPAQQPPYDVFPPAEPPYYRVRYEASATPGELIFPVNFTIWIPKDVKMLRGIIVHQHGCGEGSCKSGLTGAYDLHWQALAKKHACALLAPSYEQPEKADCQMWCDPRNGSEAAFHKCLVDLGAKSGHAELARVPWALWGHSGGGHWAGGMALLHPDRIVAAWLRSGVPLLKANPERAMIKPHILPEAALKLPMMCNLGTKEGVTVKNDRFAGVWPANEAFFTEVRSKGGLIGVAVDPLTSHECGNQRYLAIPWLDACLSARLPKAAGDSLLNMPTDKIWLAPVLGGEAVPAAKYADDPRHASWLPNEAIAKAWMEYVKDTKVTDTTPPPAPTNVRVQGNRLTWKAEADVESGLANFLIERDGQILADGPVQGKNPFGRPIFQGLQYSDTPPQPLVAMQFTDLKAEAGKNHVYRVIAVNTAGLKSAPSAVAVFGDAPGQVPALVRCGQRTSEAATMTSDQASAFARLALKAIQKEFPNKPEHVMNGPADVRNPLVLHPAFYGSFDWHSSVHGHWLLVRLLRQFPNLPERSEIRAVLKKHLTAENLKAEADYFLMPNRQSFERTYGWAWLLKLAEELHGWDDADAKTWSQNLRPLAEAIEGRYLNFLPKLTYPIRTGVHPNTAFGLAFALDYARAVGHQPLQTLITERGRHYYGQDADIPAAWEPDGVDFFSPSLLEADLMRRILPAAEYPAWLKRFLPKLAQREPKSLFTPAQVTDRSDPQIVHLDGLNLSRAWCMRSIAAALPNDDPARKALAAAATDHAAAGLRHVASGDYAGEHWLASFAVYLFSTPAPE